MVHPRYSGVRTVLVCAASLSAVVSIAVQAVHAFRERFGDFLSLITGFVPRQLGSRRDMLLSFAYQMRRRNMAMAAYAT